jgi:hypothetical protein
MASGRAASPSTVGLTGAASKPGLGSSKQPHTSMAFSAFHAAGGGKFSPHTVTPRQDPYGLPTPRQEFPLPPQAAVATGRQ